MEILRQRAIPLCGITIPFDNPVAESHRDRLHWIHNLRRCQWLSNKLNKTLPGALTLRAPLVCYGLAAISCRLELLSCIARPEVPR